MVHVGTHSSAPAHCHFAAQLFGLTRKDETGCGNQVREQAQLLSSRAGAKKAVAVPVVRGLVC